MQSPDLSFRGHHLEQLAQLVPRRYQKALTPREVAHNLRLGAQSHETDASDRELIPFTRLRKRYRRYARTILGNNPDAYEAKMGRIFERFVSDPDTTSVALLQGEPDSMCHACDKLFHCKKRVDDTFPDSDLLGLDRRYIKKVRRVADLLGLKDKLSTIPATATFFDSPPQQVERTITTLGVLRKIAQKGSQQSWRQESPDI